MKSKTYNEWKLLGYHVKRGEKSMSRNQLGEPVFTRDQVDEWFPSDWSNEERESMGLRRRN